ncbi:MAG: type II toxin-antitoxin system RelE/ParE family toxin [Xanthobacteraceae bacterium]|nr:type II toxin-antitoxin system RelE/ParE family toxin [Xanthobacteraceae bacterium]
MPKAARRIVWAPKVRQDPLNVWRYFAHVASPVIADKLLHEIRLAAERLGERPLLGRPREEVLPGLAFRSPQAKFPTISVALRRKPKPCSLTLGHHAIRGMSAST